MEIISLTSAFMRGTPLLLTFSIHCYSDIKVLLPERFHNSPKVTFQPRPLHKSISQLHIVFVEYDFSQPGLEFEKPNKGIHSPATLLEQRGRLYYKKPTKTTTSFFRGCQLRDLDGGFKYFLFFTPTRGNDPV